MPDRHTLEETERAMKEHVDALPLDFTAANALSSLFRAANAVRAELTNRVLRNHDMTWTGFVVLWVVWIWDGMETRHVAESADISKATLTGVVKTLESRGLISREGDENDRRLVRLRLTKEGVALMEQLYPEFNAVESEIVSRLSGNKVTTLTRALRDVVRSVETNHNGTAHDA
jgi:DNA-binding MarR family transcriptional regulator